jgi:hypothetical protein
MVILTVSGGRGNGGRFRVEVSRLVRNFEIVAVALKPINNLDDNVINEEESCGTFPDNRNAPAKASELISLALMAFDVGSELGNPEVYVSRWYRRVTATGMAMPVATMNKDNGTISGETKIR